MALAIVLATAALGVFLWRSVEGVSPVSVDPDVIAVLPFRVTAPDSTHNYLREGVVDLLGAQLTGDGMPRAVDSRTTLSAWRRAGDDANGDLTTDQSLALGRRLGAEQVLLGELVVTPRGKTVSGRLLDSRGGRVVAEHSESGAVDAVLLIHRLVGRLLARTTGEASARLPTLSDSLEAVKAYIAGMRALRGSELAAARDHFGRAFDIDSTFALTALRLTRLGPNPEMIRRRADQAWALRTRLSPRDRALLTTHFAIGPNYPLPTPTVEHLRARERLAVENPDFLDAWVEWGNFVLQYGQQVGWRDSREQAAAAFDHAIALDSTFGQAWEGRHLTAMLMGDKEKLRELIIPYGITNTRGDFAVFDKWFAAQLLGDTTQADSLRQQLEPSNDFLLSTWGWYAASLGISLEDPEHAIVDRMKRRLLPATARRDFQRSLLHIAALRGRVADVHARADSVTDPLLKISLALADPAYEAVGNAEAEFLGRFADTALDANQLCYRELWRVHRGDTADTRRGIVRIRALVSDLDPAAFPRVGRFEVCPFVLEAALEGWQGTGGATPALDRLESVLRQGTGLELPGNLATLMVARARAAQGNHRAALDVVRRRPSPVGAHHFTIVLPAHLREEGRLAALVGDTAGAIRAYRHYLTVRDQPNPGPMEEEVRLVRSHLAELLGER